ncbi:SWIB-domain-containing protein [Backusella circina FSU 941]|nr:SWIB-domain-containing protein [Backusella circina FSU 941]KAI8888224.1 SWIB-domain-containing protein [Backusella circina FSU 941]
MNFQDNYGCFELLPQEEQVPEPPRSPTVLHDLNVALYTTNQLITSVPQIQFSLNEDKSSNIKKQPNKIKINPGNSIKKKQKSKKKKLPVDPNAPPKPKRATGLDKPLILSSPLSAIMDGNTELSRPEIVKRLWIYIKTNKLQDPADRRYILCDEKLKSIFHQDRVNSFGMNKDLTAHLTKKETNNETMNKSVAIGKDETQLSVTGDFSPIQTAETPNTMTPIDNDHVLMWNII